MAETYATQAAKLSGTKPVVRVVPRGIPWKRSGISAAGADGDGSTAYSVRSLSLITHSPANYTSQQRVGYKQVILPAGVTFSGERIDFATGKTTIGQVTIAFIDPHVTDYIGALFAARSFARLDNLTADADRGDTSLAIRGTPTAVALGQAVWVSRECMVVTNIGTPTAPVVLRGALVGGGAEQTHLASTDREAHADALYSGPVRWRGQELDVYFGFDHADLDEDDELGPVRFYMRGSPERDQGGWILAGDSMISLLDKAYARGTFVGRVMGRVDTGLREVLAGQRANDTGIVLTPVHVGRDRQVAFPTVGEIVYFSAGSEVFGASVRESTDALLRVRVTERRALLGTQRDDDAVATKEWREILVTDPQLTDCRVGHVPYSAGWAYANFVASAHPYVAFLCLALSRTGDMSNATTNQRSYDVLPAPWGLGETVPIALINQAAFEAAIEETPSLVMPHFRLGIKEGEGLRTWWNREVAPIAMHALVSTLTGQISLARIGFAFPLDIATTLDAGDIVSVGKYRLSEAEQPGAIVGYRSEDGAHESVDVASVMAQDIDPDAPAPRPIELDGAASATRQHITDRLVAAVFRGENPVAELPLRARWEHHNSLSPGSAVTLSVPVVHSIETGSYEIDAETWQVASRELAPLAASPGVNVVLRRATERTAHLGPAATVSAYVDGTVTLTLSANDYSPTTTTSAFVRTADVKGFGVDGSQGGAGAYCAIYSKRGVRLTDPFELVTLSYAGNTAIGGAALVFIGGGTYTVTAGDVLRLAPLTASVSGAVAGGTISADQEKFAFQATVASGVVNASRPAYVWGH